MRVSVVRKWPFRGRSRFVLAYHTSKSVVTVQRAFRAKYAKVPPTDKTIRALYKQFTETGCLCKQKSRGRPLTAEDNVERIRTSFLHSPKKSTATAAKELSMSKTTVRRVLRKRLVFKPYRIQMVQQLSDEGHRRRLDFWLQLQELLSYWVSVHFFLLRIVRVSCCPLDRLPARHKVSLVVGLPPWCL